MIKYETRANKASDRFFNACIAKKSIGITMFSIDIDTISIGIAPFPIRIKAISTENSPKSI